MGTHVNKKREYVRKLLRQSFSGAPQMMDDPIPKRDLIELRSLITRMTSEALKFYLPRILEDLLDADDEHGEVLIENFGSVAMALDVGVSYNTEQVSLVSPEEQRYLTKLGMEKFKDLDSSQATAILEWLKIAKTWRGASINREELDEAIAYWSRRANG